MYSVWLQMDRILCQVVSSSSDKWALFGCVLWFVEFYYYVIWFSTLSTSRISTICFHFSFTTYKLCVKRMGKELYFISCHLFCLVFLFDFKLHAYLLIKGCVCVCVSDIGDPFSIYHSSVWWLILFKKNLISFYQFFVFNCVLISV